MKKTRDGKKSTDDTFFLTFVGEIVRIAGNFKIDDEKLTISITGFILDIDDEFYYLGETPNEISCAIKKNAVVFIEILTPVNQYEEILNDMEIPEEENKKN